MHGLSQPLAHSHLAAVSPRLPVATGHLVSPLILGGYGQIFLKSQDTFSAIPPMGEKVWQVTEKMNLLFSDGGCPPSKIASKSLENDVRMMSP